MSDSLTGFAVLTQPCPVYVIRFGFQLSARSAPPGFLSRLCFPGSQISCSHVLFFFFKKKQAVVIDFRFCLSSLAQQGFVFPICSIWCGLHVKGVFSNVTLCLAVRGDRFLLVSGTGQSSELIFHL
jgi:hypothetical protein